MKKNLTIEEINFYEALMITMDIQLHMLDKAKNNKLFRMKLKNLSAGFRDELDKNFQYIFKDNQSPEAVDYFIMQSDNVFEIINIGRRIIKMDSTQASSAMYILNEAFKKIRSIEIKDFIEIENN